MSQTRSRARLAAGALGSLALAALAGAGCAANLNFNSPSPLGTGVEGKAWQVPYFVDTPLYIPEALGVSTTYPIAWDFAAAASGSSLQLVGSWWDAGSSIAAPVYRGYERLYQDGVSWSPLGPNFGQIASDIGNSFSSVSIAAGANGLYMSNFFDGFAGGSIFNSDAPGSFDGASAYYTGTAWQPAINNNGGYAGAAPFSNAPSPGSTVASTIDSLGRGYLFYSDGTAVYETQWGLANPTGVTSSAGTPSVNGVYTLATGAISATAAITTRFDGVAQVCATSESTTGVLRASCQDISCTGPFTFNALSGAASTTVIDSSVLGHDTATDSAGNIMAVYYKGQHIYASLGTFSGSCPVFPAVIASETWTSPIQLDQLNDGYLAPSNAPTLWPTGTRPGITYVGSGRFLVAWIGYNASVTPASTQIYSILYDPANGGWQGAGLTSLGTPIPGSLQAVPGSYEAYNTKPHPQSLTVFGNGAGNAGFAINNIVTTDIIPTPTPASTLISIYPETAQVRAIKVDRWQQDDGWIANPPQSFGPVISGGSVLTPGVTCFNYMTVDNYGNPIAGASNNSAGIASGGQSDCTHPPVGVLLPSGTTVVLFQAQDNYSQRPGTKIPGTATPSASGSVIPGNRRVGALEFK